MRFLIVIFYFLFQTLCEPQEYKPMLHKEHAQDLRHFRAKSKSFTVGEKRKKASIKLSTKNSQHASLWSTEFGAIGLTHPPHVKS